MATFYLEVTSSPVEQISLVLTPVLRQIARRCYSDVTFRQELHLNPESTLEKAGLSLTAKELNTVKTYLNTVTTHIGTGAVPTKNEAEWLME